MAGAGNIAASKHIEINDLGYNIETIFIIYIHTLSGMLSVQFSSVSEKGSFCQTIHNSSFCVKRYFQTDPRPCPQMNQQSNQTVHISTVPA